jgi:hypothetical protein
VNSFESILFEAVVQETVLSRKHIFMCGPCIFLSSGLGLIADGLYRFPVYGSIRSYLEGIHNGVTYALPNNVGNS